MANSWVVHKFGGTSLADAESVRRAADIVRQPMAGDPSGPAPRPMVVVSASAGITDALIDLSRLPPGESRASGLSAIRDRQLGLAEELLSSPLLDRYRDELNADLASLDGLLAALDILGVLPEEAAGLVAGYGEYWSARLLARLLQDSDPDASWLDAREVITVSASELGPVVDWDASSAGLDRVLEELPRKGPVVVTGFVARTADGRPTTLGRNGSDFTASIFGALLDADRVVIWTDVEGVLSGDPRVVRDARTVPRLSYEEAMELAYFGARVIHPATMAPLIARDIPLQIRSTFAPEGAGTRIDGSGSGGEGVRGITVIEDMALVNLQGAGMIGVPGTADRLFGALQGAGISVVMISQGSSEHSICFAVREEDAASARQVVSRAFSLELAEGQIQSVEIEPGCGILAVVGDGMRGVPGVAARMFGALGRAGVNVRAIAQGASERNISAVIATSDAPRALRAVHAGFYLSPRAISLGLVGPGGVGREFLAQLAPELDRLREASGVDIRLRGVANSRTMALAEDELSLGDWEDALAAGPTSDLQAFGRHIHSEHLPHAVIIDCTASQATADRYAEWLSRGIHVITANKRAGSGPGPALEVIRDAAAHGRASFLYETTAGAGLPIVGTLRDLRETGDRIVSVEGMLSGTLAYLFNSFDGARPFSAIVQEALELGYTEPDPRDDLSGMDVARKVVILGREMGLSLEVEDVEVDSLVPPDLASGSIDAFMSALPRVDEEMARRLSDAREAGRVLRFVGRVDARGTASVGLVALPSDHPFAHGALTDNVVQFTTARYHDNPLVVQGPGAGREVTAAGVFADLLRLATSLGGAW